MKERLAKNRENKSTNMNKVNKVLILSSILSLFYLPCKAQIEIVKDPPSEIVDAFYSNDTTLMSEYIKSGKYPMGYKPSYRISPIESAIWKNRIAIVMFLINNAGFTLTNDDISSMLYREHVNIDEFNSLLSLSSGKNKIDVTKWKEKYLNEWENESSDGAILNGYYYFRFKLIIMYGFDLINVVDSEQRTEFYISVIEHQDLELLDLLNYEDEAFNGHTCNGPTVLTSAVYSKNYYLVKYLVDKGLDKTVRIFEACYDDAKEGPNAYEIALSLGNKELIDLLKD
ncbi:ankyrin repeat domain-containing protein [Bacteroides sp. 224]|uniref:ankyrin repeat domain-containing protein n=1 Tax=Bacteroides sp. 224 TaxID=2302936 RepID=UPI0013D45C82|nr:ankyrin repeat domain-containing protein [Bacteroides sp. 224]NDV66692.1 hypothetical protein [Bacteroides sp. 224]